MKKVELLAPCGSFDCVKAALNAGADAVYLGGQAFGARAYAANFDLSSLEQVCDLCHTFGVKVYVTVNTLYKDAEIPELLRFIERLYVMGADGLIMQDLGAIRLVRSIWPDFPVHASTQLTATSLNDVLEMEAWGLTTAVLSRELNLQEIREICTPSHIRIETFIHGALCVSYSGQCLMSSVLGSRSGNRGKCAQNCRLPYELTDGKKVLANGHLLSTKDICTLHLLPELVHAGVDSLKIEGRMKSAEYVAGVTGIYRKYLDRIYTGAPYSVDPDDLDTLRQLFNRGGFSKGYLNTHSGMDMMCPDHPKHWGVRVGKVSAYQPKKHSAAIRFEKNMTAGDGIEIRTDSETGVGGYLNHPVEAGNTLVVNIEGKILPSQAVYRTWDKRLMDSLKPCFETVQRKMPLQATINLHSGHPAELTFSTDDVSVTVQGKVPSAAQNQPLTEESVTAQIRKLGATIYQAESIETNIESGLYLNKSALNSLKNLAAEQLRKNTIEKYKRSGDGLRACAELSPSPIEEHNPGDGLHACTELSPSPIEERNPGDGLRACAELSPSPIKEHNSGDGLHACTELSPSQMEEYNLKELAAKKPCLSICVSHPDQFKAALECSVVSVIFLEPNDLSLQNLKEFTGKAHHSGKRIAVKLPRIWRKYMQETSAHWLRDCMESEMDGFLISSPGHYHSIKKSGKVFWMDFTGNVLNSQTYEFWKSLGAETIGLSPEMSREEINSLADTSRAELLAYGYLPLMITHQCPVGNFIGQKKNSIHCRQYGKNGEYFLCSGKERFRLQTDCQNCLCTITPEFPMDIREDINSFKLKSFRINLTNESYEETFVILKNYKQFTSGCTSPVKHTSNIYDKSIL